MKRFIGLSVVVAASVWLASVSRSPWSAARGADEPAPRRATPLTNSEIQTFVKKLRELGLSAKEIAAIKGRLEKIELNGRTLEARSKELSQSPDIQALLKELRRKFAFKSLEDRLAFEKGVAKLGVKLDKEALERLAYIEFVLRANGKRTAALSLLHGDQVARFVAIEEVGVRRTVNVGFPTEPRSIDLPTLARTKPLTPAEIGAPVSLPNRTGGAGGPQAMPAFNELWNMHRTGQLDFLDADRLGFSKKRRVAAGFEAHGLRYPPMLHTTAVKHSDKERWLVRRTELVSLLMHDKPAVYLTDELPRMDKLSAANVKTRPLDEFEAKALAALRKGEDVYADATTNAIRMVGSIRAARQCLTCHDCDRGALLGAFSYQLQRDPPLLGK